MCGCSRRAAARAIAPLTGAAAGALRNVAVAHVEGGEVSGTIGPVEFADSDRDSSPVIAGAVGLEAEDLVDAEVLGPRLERAARPDEAESPRQPLDRLPRQGLSE